VSPDEPELLDDETLRRLERLSLRSLRAVTVGLAGERAGRITGPRADFADYRRYVPGDELRRVDWNVYARLRQLAVKVGAEEGRLSVHVLLDTSRSMLLGTPQKLLFGQRLAALVGAVALLGGDTARVVALADGAAHPLALLDGARRLPALLAEIRRAPVGRETRLAAGVDDYRRSSTHADLLVLVTDANAPPDDLDDALRGAVAASGDVGLLHVVAADELRPELRGPVTLRDAETGEELELDLDDAALARYELLERRFLDSVEGAVRRHGAGYVRGVTDVAPLEVLLGSAAAPISTRA
jgi:uncharacterized protein (DUF58 family)